MNIIFKCENAKYSDCSIAEFHVFVKFLCNEVAASTDLFSWARSARTFDIVTEALSIFMYFLDSYTTRLLHSVIFFWVFMGEQSSIYDTVISVLPNFTTFNVLRILVFCLLRILLLYFNVRLILCIFTHVLRNYH